MKKQRKLKPVNKQMTSEVGRKHWDPGIESEFPYSPWPCHTEAQVLRELKG